MKQIPAESWNWPCSSVIALMQDVFSAGSVSLTFDSRPDSLRADSTRVIEGETHCVGEGLRQGGHTALQ